MSFFSVFIREFRSLFATPVAYVFTAVFLFLAGLLTFVFGGFFQRGEASLAAPFFKNIPLLLALFAPCLSMRVWSSEYHQGTLDLLFSHPVSIPSLVLAKFFATLAALSVPLLLTLSFVFTTMYLGSPDYGVLASSYLGTILLGGAFIAISCACSALSRSQVVAFVLATTVCLLLVFLGGRSFSRELLSLFPESRFMVDSMAAIAVEQHFAGFRKGLIEVRSILFFLSLSGVALLANIIIILKKQF